jgi:hypothetical protein
VLWIVFQQAHTARVLRGLRLVVRRKFILLATLALTLAEFFDKVLFLAHNLKHPDLIGIVLGSTMIASFSGNVKNKPLNGSFCVTKKVERFANINIRVCV